ncbi:hypothetical protein [Nesterenkonia halobia]|uniref:Uncharacterized protein n=1 Tax=Nesterenkonia halobia TaxID=37922 RepID=A0ABP6RFP3_9MICC
MTSTTADDLWRDWCAVTGTAEDQLDEATLQRFAATSGASQKVLATLRGRRSAGPRPADEPPSAEAPAWPVEQRDEPRSLQRLITHGSTIIATGSTGWIARLRMRRLLFAAVLLAPPDHGGLGLSRSQVRAMTPRRLAGLREQVGVSDDEHACPACAVWSWLEIVGTNNGWSPNTVRTLGRRRDEIVDGSTRQLHRHQREDPSPEWADWPDHPALLPAIDQWGYIDLYASLHPSSLSVLVRTVAELLASPVPAMPEEEDDEPDPVAPAARHVSAEEEVAILARADELNARIEKILAETR